MAVHPNEILAMSDQELQLWALSGDVGSYVHELGQTAMNMRCSLRMVEATNQMVQTTNQLAQASKGTTAPTGQLVQHTRNLALATWGIVVITLLTQIALIVLTVVRR